MGCWYCQHAFLCMRQLFCIVMVQHHTTGAWLQCAGMILCVPETLSQAGQAAVQGTEMHLSARQSGKCLPWVGLAGRSV
jgi:hypothetical protein